MMCEVVEQMKILLIDDDRMLRRAIERTLGKAGYNMISAADGEEGLRLATETNPDLIVLDMMLPKLTGLGVLRTLKQNRLTKQIPVIVLSGLSQHNEAKLRKEGAAAYIKKPETFDDNLTLLIYAIESVLGNVSLVQPALSDARS
jgi:two-component system, OmpR family, alkaline phosphatase synthesis response regulator PhoP